MSVWVEIRCGMEWGGCGQLLRRIRLYKSDGPTGWEAELVDSIPPVLSCPTHGEVGVPGSEELKLTQWEGGDPVVWLALAVHQLEKDPRG